MRWLPLFCLTALMLVGLEPLHAQDTKQSDPPKEEGAATKKGAEKDPYALPEDAEVAELLKFINDQKTRRPQAKTREELITHYRKSRRAISDAADKVLAMEPEEADAIKAIKEKVAALGILTQVGERSANVELLKFAESLKNDPREEIAKLAAFELLKGKVASLERLKTTKSKQAVLNEVVAYLEQAGVDRGNYRLAMDAPRTLERAGETEMAATAYDVFGRLLGASDDERISRYGVKYAGAARRVRLPGNPIEVKGTTVDGKDFDIASLKGKVILVDFWATWCGPCIGELPNVVANYEKYHDHGFEVVAISLDRDKEKLENFIEDREIPWTNLYSTDEDSTGWDNPIATHYGIMGIPTTILVGRDGNVISLSARGPKLGKLLEQAIGPVKTKPSTSDAAESTSGD